MEQLNDPAGIPAARDTSQGPATRGKRSRTKFSLRTVLGLVFLVCLAAGWLSSKIQTGRKQRQAMTAIQQRGGEVICLSWGGHEWLESLLGEDVFLEVSGVIFPRDTSVSDDCLASLSHFPTLHTLDLVGTRLKDAELVHLKDLTALKVLRLGGTQVTDAGMVQIAKLSQLEELDLSDTQITNAGLDPLAGFPRLLTVDLTRTRVNHAGIVERFGPQGPPFFVAY